MELKELKESLVELVINDLEQLGLNTDEIHSEDIVNLYTTTDEYCKERNEATWVASVSKGSGFCVIAQGTLYDKEAIEETGREIEVGRVFVDEDKAEMLISALYHAFPDKIYEKVLEEEDSEASEEEEDLDNLDTLNEDIGTLKRELARLELLRKNQKVRTLADGDECITTYKKVRRFASTLSSSSVDPIIIRRKNTVVFVSGFQDKKLIRITQANISNIVNEQIQDMPASKITKTILLDKKLVKALVETISKTFE